jgi:hypothetical protein
VPIKLSVDFDHHATTTTKPFYSQASWGRLEMKPHEPKKRYKTRAKKNEKQRAIKKPNQKSRKDNKTLSQKSKKGVGKKLDKRQ